MIELYSSFTGSWVWTWSPGGSSAWWTRMKSASPSSTGWYVCFAALPQQPHSWVDRLRKNSLHPRFSPLSVPLNARGPWWKPHMLPSARLSGPMGKITVILNRTDKIRRRKLLPSWMWKSGCRPEGLLTAGSLYCDIIELCGALTRVNVTRSVPVLAAGLHYRTLSVV